MSLCLIGLFCICCSQDRDRISSAESKVKVLYPGDEYFMNPMGEGGFGADRLVFLPLLTSDEKGELLPHLATHWEHSLDYRTWTIHIRKDVKWHDGLPVTAHDIKFSMELWDHAELLMSAPSAKITVFDDFSFNVTYKKPSRNILNDWQVFYPKHLLENLDPAEIETWEFWTQPVGNGPYRYARHVSKTMMELEANPAYFKRKPKIERVIFKFGGASRVTELLSGDVDIITNVSRLEILELKDDPRFSVYHWINPNAFIAIHWNHRHPFFGDPLIRRALTHAINRQELLDVLNMPDVLPIFDVPFTKRQLWRGELPEPLSFNPELASQLLEKAGWRDRDIDGIRQKNAKKFRFSILVSDREFSDEKPAVYIKEQLRKVGVRMEITPLAFSLLHRRYKAGDFDAAIHVFENLPGTTMWYSYFGYDNPPIFHLHKLAETTADLDELDNIYKEIMAIHRRDIPITFLYHVVNSTVSRKSIKGLSTPFRADPILSMEHLWIEENK
ncbi:MAG: peptide ABC transporter substrate-binding protein [Candidatus Aminicenantes bacterium]